MFGSFWFGEVRGTIIMIAGEPQEIFAPRPPHARAVWVREPDGMPRVSSQGAGGEALLTT